MTTIGYIVGSISSTSINRTLAEALAKLAPEGVEFREIAIKDLPFYSPDLDGSFPQVALDFKAAVRSADALLFVTPEYNRSLPGALKNAIDWGSRPWGQNAWSDKPVGVIGAGRRDFRVRPSLSKHQIRQWLLKLRRFRYDESTTLGRRVREMRPSLESRSLIVALSDLHDPEGSPRNHWRGRITDIDHLGDRVRVRLDGDLPIVAEVTPASVAELGLAVGLGVTAAAKASELSVEPA